jgi:DNA-binding MarR family transcriptional regulator
MEPVRKERAIDSAFANSLYFAGGAFSRAIEKLAKECWIPSGLTPSQGNLLLHLIDNYYAFSCFISSDLRVNPSSVTRLADQLEEKGLIDRTSYHHWTYLEATEKAVELLPILARLFNQATDKLTEQKSVRNVK